MDGLPAARRRRTVFSIRCRAAAAVAVLGVAASCSAGPGGGPAGPASTQPAATQPAATAGTAATGPVTAEISQFRDNYAKQIIEIQLTNTTGGALRVLGAELTSPLFAGQITWQATAGGIELPPGQTKSLPASLPAPECGSPAPTPAAPGAASGDDGSAQVSLRLMLPESSVPESSVPESGVPESGVPESGGPESGGPESGGPAAAATAPAADPFGVLVRNNAEMCVTRAAAAVAAMMLAPDLEVAADGRTAVVRLLITPRAAGGTAAAGELVLERIEETTLLAEAPQAPWPHDLTLRAGGFPVELRLGIRPARCDPHAVAEDKVGTLLPLRVSVGGRQGVLKIDAGDKLRGRIYEFVTTACGRQ
ncbi:hypothetical protein [Arthrobacter sp. NicSoilB8]|uniref:hypothetical protein n=1 Tax=Arthrobacter sp. NicSoilB8 TaxID=2830998 RepID=UPI001CC78EC2|nr:hypothetical protein [Arthrobacter sp. NicSoilB8]BCW71291.1 hypothetical protein NicSoilB8_23350 [Arthrobacter sp. NicSoilB8]